jgi:hypothetical protein
LTKSRTCANNNYCECVHAVELEPNELVELVIVNEATIAEYHPIHLHGHSFSLLGSATLSTKRSGGERLRKRSQVIELDKQGLLKRNLHTPPSRDTVSVPMNGYTIIRFVADNPGVWPLHCHIDVHSDMAMMMLFRVGTGKDLPPKPDNRWFSCGGGGGGGDGPSALSPWQQQERLKKAQFNYFSNSASKLRTIFHSLFVVAIFFSLYMAG